MIKTLRRRLTLLVACVLVLVTAGIVLSIRAINLRNIDTTARAALAVLSENRGQRPGQMQQAPPDLPDGETPPPKPEGNTAPTGDNLPPHAPTDGETPPPKPEGDQVPPQRPGIDMPGGNSLASLSNAYTIRLDKDGNVTEWSSDRSDLYTDAQVQAMARAVLAAGDSEGRIDTQYYRLIDDGEGGEERLLIVLDARLGLPRGCCAPRRWWPRWPDCCWGRGPGC